MPPPGAGRRRRWRLRAVPRPRLARRAEGPAERSGADVRARAGAGAERASRRRAGHAAAARADGRRRGGHDGGFPARSRVQGLAGPRGEDRRAPGAELPAPAPPAAERRRRPRRPHPRPCRPTPPRKRSPSRCRRSTRWAWPTTPSPAASSSAIARRTAGRDRRAVASRDEPVSAASAGFYATITAFEIDARRGDLWVASAYGDGRTRVHKLQLVSGRVLEEVRLPASEDVPRSSTWRLPPTGPCSPSKGRPAASSGFDRGPAPSRTPASCARRAIRSLALVDDRLAYVSSDEGISQVDLGTCAATPVRAGRRNRREPDRPPPLAQRRVDVRAAPRRQPVPHRSGAPRRRWNIDRATASYCRCIGDRPAHLDNLRHSPLLPDGGQLRPSIRRAPLKSISRPREISAEHRSCSPAVQDADRDPDASSAGRGPRGAAHPRRSAHQPGPFRRQRREHGAARAVDRAARRAVPARRRRRVQRRQERVHQRPGRRSGSWKRGSRRPPRR